MKELPDLSGTPMLPVLESLFDGVIAAVPDPWRIVYANPSLERWLGRGLNELRGQPLEAVFDSESRGSIRKSLEQFWHDPGAEASIAAELELPDGGRCAADVRLCRVTLDETPFLVLVLQRASESPLLVPAQAQRRDPLTGLSDRDFLFTRLETLLRGARSADRRFAVLFVDLDNFKQINDEHGHLMGDRVLREVGRRLTSCVREGDHVVRFGGDEFVVLVHQVTSRDEIDPVIERIHAALARPIALPHGEFTLSLSVGVAVASPEHHSPEDLLHDADRAMYAAKRAVN